MKHSSCKIGYYNTDYTMEENETFSTSWDGNVQCGRQRATILALLHSAEPKWHFWSSLVQTFWTSVWMYSFELAGEKVPTKVEWMLSYSTQTDGDFVVKFKLVFACNAEKYLKI